MSPECPKCKSSTYLVKYGKCKSGTGNASQRYKCKKCGITLNNLHKHPFFRRMRVKPKTLLRAIELYNEGATIKDIAKDCHTRPNTIIIWFRKVQKNKSSYRAYLVSYFFNRPLHSTAHITPASIHSNLPSYNQNRISQRKKPRVEYSTNVWGYVSYVLKKFSRYRIKIKTRKP